MCVLYKMLRVLLNLYFHILEKSILVLPHWLFVSWQSLYLSVGPCFIVIIKKSRFCICQTCTLLRICSGSPKGRKTNNSTKWIIYKCLLWNWTINIVKLQWKLMTAWTDSKLYVLFAEMISPFITFILHKKSSTILSKIKKLTQLKMKFI